MTHSERFARLRLVLGDEGLVALQGSTVMVLGLGGVGSACAEALARGGVGGLVLLDRDVVEESNINRQALAFLSTVGRVKAEVMGEMVADINPDCRTITQQVFLSPENLADTLDAHPRPDYVIDCIDTISQKLAIAQWCAERGLPLLSSMGAANKLDPTQLEFASIERTRSCPLSRVIRRECRRRGIAGLEVLSSRELPVAVDSSGGWSKSETLGSMSYMPPVMGQMLAGLAIRRLAGLAPMPAPPHLVHRTPEQPVTLLDSHHHFDFLTGVRARRHFLAQLASDDVRLVAQTLAPSDFMELVAQSNELGDGTPLPLWSVGFHPWYIEDADHAQAELAVFAQAVQQTRFVGEVGLDFSPRRLEQAPPDLQRRVLRELLEHTCQAAEQGSTGQPHVVSLHAVRSAGDVLDLLTELDATNRNVVPVFHRFGGTSNDLTRLIKLGGHLSVHPQLLTRKRGRAFLQQVPADRLLLESDLPRERTPGEEQEDPQETAAEAARELVSSLTQTLTALSQLRQWDMATEITQTQSRLYGIG
ncbi:MULTISPECIES: TatD family hydrolase [unclassified Luteococcus]|uniref:TatD family hydrolase n=1 Tax=unclassified Luteococcus TaxID=2639923 RepID=UPI00313EEB80